MAAAGVAAAVGVAAADEPREEEGHEKKPEGVGHESMREEVRDSLAVLWEEEVGPRGRGREAEADERRP